MRFLLCALTALCSGLVSGNDSTGYVGTGGVQYIKNDNISMQSEDLFISKKIIKVDYQFKNLSAKDITETILFPLPRIDNFFEADFADTEKLLKTFKVNVDGKDIQPNMHVRTFIQKDEDSPVIDTTELFKKCGFSETEMLNPWNRKNYEYSDFAQKLRRCKNLEMQKILQSFDDDMIPWSSQVIYSWKQTFKANALTRVQHQYQPLVGGSIGFSIDEGDNNYCIDENLKKTLRKNKVEHSSYQALGYILTTGANWAKPIKDFKLTIERDPHEYLSLCWDGKINKISSTRFQMIEKNFIPKQDLDIMFINPQRRYD